MKLIAKTKKGRERIKQAGTDQVRLLRTRISIPASSEDGPWLFVAFIGADECHSRWIHKSRDNDFEIAE